MGREVDLVGQKFNRLTVVCKEGVRKFPNGRTATVWKCICDCQLSKEEQEKVYTYATTTELRGNQIKSCGCLKRELLRASLKKYNTYDLESEDYGIGYTLKGEPFYFDKEDYDLIKEYCWTKRYDGYIISRNKNGKTIRLHRLVMGVTDPSIVVDHIKHNPLDNRKALLRIGNKHTNAANHKIFSTNKSGYTGVQWNEPMHGWIARITVNYKDIILGYYKNIDDAIKARKEAEEKYFGEWSYENSMKDSKEVF